MTDWHRASRASRANLKRKSLCSPTPPPVRTQCPPVWLSSFKQAARLHHGAAASLQRGVEWADFERGENKLQNKPPCHRLFPSALPPTVRVPLTVREWGGGVTGPTGADVVNSRGHRLPRLHAAERIPDAHRCFQWHF